jgi:hypothetical protein
MLEHGPKKALAALSFVAALGVTPSLMAQVQDCTELEANPDNGTVIYGAGGSAVTATLAKIAIYLASRPVEERITVVYYDPGACQGYQQYLDNAITGNIPNTSIKYWTSGSAEAGSTCTLEQPHAADFAHMGNPHDFCGFSETLPGGYPTGFGTVQAPIQTLNIIVDKDSSQKSISAEALYYLYGLGAVQANIEPWVHPTDIVVRQTSSFVHQLIATAIFNNDERQFFDDPAANGQGDGTIGNGRLGFRATTNGQVVTRVAAANNQSAESSIGFASGSAAETATARTSIKTLAYQHYDQTLGFWPDSTESALDKANVRSGKYHLWSPGHFYARVADGAAVDGSGNLESLDSVENAGTRELFRLFTTAEDDEALRRIIQAGDIPLCASRVTRDGLLGAVSSVAPPDPCHGFFESVATGSTSGACGDNDDCGSDLPECRHGFCEAY